MDKRSPKSPVLYERNKSGCAWSLIRFCDLGQVHSNGKPISHGRGLNSQVLDVREIKNGLDFLSNLGDKCQSIDDGANKKSFMIDSGKADVMRIKEGEIATEPQVKKNLTNTRRQNALSDTQPVSNLPSKHKRKASKTFQMYGCKDMSTVGHRQPSCQNSLDKSSRKINTAAATEASCSRAHPKNVSDCSSRSFSHQKYDQLSEVNLQVKINEAAEAFINQKFIEGEYLGKNRASHESKHFLDALEILNSNKELFIKLLQDPNSLLMKHIQDLHHSQAKEKETKSSSEAKLSENCRTIVRDSVDPRTSDRIVVLKPGSTTMQNCGEDSGDCSSSQSLYSLRNRVQSTKPAYFSFGSVKRKLRHAIGLSRKEKPQMSTDCKLHKSPSDIQGLGDGSKGKDRENAENNSFSKIDLVTDEIEKSSSVKRRDKLGKVRDSQSGTKEQVALNGGSDHGNSKLSVVRHLKQRESNIYFESRTSLFRVFRDRNEDFSRKQIPVNSRRIVSLPEYDILSAFSRGRHKDHGYFASQMRFSPYSYYQAANEKKQILQREKKNGYATDQWQILNNEPNTSDNHFPNIRRHEVVCSQRGTSSSSGSTKTVDMYTPGEINALGVPLEPNRAHNNGADHSACPADRYGDNKYFDCPKLDSSTENCTSSPPERIYSSSPVSGKKLEDSDGMNDKAEHPSPVSVLEQLFLEDITSPLSTIPQSVEPAIEPKQDNYVEQQRWTALVTSPEDVNVNYEHESISQYIMAVLQVSGIKWEELSMKFHSSDQFLEPSLLRELELLLPNQFSDDRKLLLDYINEVLQEIHQCYFSSSPQVSFLRPKIQPVEATTNAVNEVMKCVDWNILSQHPSLNLEQLVQKDLAKSRTWMDIRTDAEDAVTELVESVLEELTLEMSIDLHI